jgi:DNA invertase Pin-like site-specific DNA recombinase
MNASRTSGLYGYGRASTDKQIASPETQRHIIEDYAKRHGRTVDRFFVDPAVSGKKPLFERAGGKELSLLLKPGAQVIVARLDRLTRSFIGFAHILEFLLKNKIKMHICDMPGDVFDPENPMSELMIGVLIMFANYERRLISIRTREGLQARKQRGEKYCRWADYGWRWEKRLDPRLKKEVNVKVPEEQERVMMRKAVELRAAGWSFDKIRQVLTYSMKARTRLGGDWTNGGVGYLVQQGLRFLAQSGVGTSNQTIASADGEAGDSEPIQLEDENDG